MYVTDCPVDRCYLGCDQDCFCNSIITGISKDNAICPYGCGERAFAIGDSQNICHKREYILLKYCRILNRVMWE